MNDAKNALAEKSLKIKRKKKLSWKKIGEKVGMNPIWTTAACLGQMSMLPEHAARAAKFLGLDKDDELTLTEIPYRGSLPPGPPTDPLIYRFHELVQVYGTTWKEMIHEEFGDGIMSAIDFKMDMKREPNAAGDRVNITMSGKFLPYKSY